MNVIDEGMLKVIEIARQEMAGGNFSKASELIDMALCGLRAKTAKPQKRFVITLPYPISANRYWHSFNLGPRIMTAPTKEAKEYKAQVGWMLRAAGVRQPITGRVRVHLDVYAKRPQDWQLRMRKFGALWDNTVKRLDIDNARKVIYDSLKEIAIDDDFWIWTDSADIREPDGEPRIVVTITPIVVEQPQAALL